ncbi:peroxidase [Ramlibacter monticola]|uniref:Peroxidase n=1 Tax=Ramlibacter monticola TaxID=1926872 RepID=A0A936Z8U1_9BURK|nr:hypothetical protein [Ramlibacter monticola]MBL0394660.1 hypothetical protein [Ramlibacter monticola]
MEPKDVQALLLRPVYEKAVLHLVYRVTPGEGGAAREDLKRLLLALPVTYGNETGDQGLHCTIGFTYRGLEALDMPDAYLRVYSRLAPGFKQGAPLRAGRLGDTGASAPANWVQGFGLDDAHVLLTVHGSVDAVEEVNDVLAPCRGNRAPLQLVETFTGKRLGAPSGGAGQWVHFRFRDGLVNHCIQGIDPARRPAEKNSRMEHIPHAAGEFLLGHPDDDNGNLFALGMAPAKVREFFRSSSFGVLRPIRQDVAGFQEAVTRWAAEARAQLDEEVGEDWIRAKLGGRWPSGEKVLPGRLKPEPDDFELDFARDREGFGCPWSSHVRRMDARGHPGSGRRQRPVLRRGMPYGTPNWEGAQDQQERGLLGLFFCASLEDQFELLVGEWAQGAPPGEAGAEGAEMASDVFAGRNGDAEAAALVPVPGRPSLQLRGFRAWTRTLGTAYMWCPSGPALDCILRDDYPDKDKGGPWL